MRRFLFIKYKNNLTYMRTAEDIKQQIQELLKTRPSINLDILYTYTPAFGHLHEILNATETIKGYCISTIEVKGEKTSPGKWLIVYTNERMIFVFKGMLTGLKHFSIALDQLKTIQPKTNFFFGGLILKSEQTEVKLFQTGKKDHNFFIESLEQLMKELSTRQ